MTTQTLTDDQRTIMLAIVSLKRFAVMALQHEAALREARANWERKRDVAMAAGEFAVAELCKEKVNLSKELGMEARFAVIERGEHVAMLLGAADEILPRELALELLGVNRKHWHSDDMRKYGDTLLNVVSVLRLENSETRDDYTYKTPLQRCFERCLFNRLQTHEGFAKAAHEEANKVFGGAFGEFREKSLTERLGFPA